MNEGAGVYKMPKEYLDQSFWTRPAKSRTSAASDKLIHIGVGHALSNWEHVEAAASILFSHLVDSRSIAAQRAYGSIIGARGKADALRQAAEIYFSLRRNQFEKKDRLPIKAVGQMERHCNVFIHNYTAASGRRNDIAHGIAWELSQSNNENSAWYLVAPLYQSSRNENWIADDIKLRARMQLRLADKEARFEFNKIYYKNTDYVYGVSEIKVFAGKFAYLRAHMLSFISVMDSHRVPATTAELIAVAKKMGD